MAQCYAQHLGDCQGRIEDEHFIPRSLQRMVGPVTLRGFAWQDGTSVKVQPGSYAHARVICQRHHDRLDGLDANAVAYFRNLMLIANPNHIASGVRGRAADIALVLDGRGLEKWFLKTICGAVNTNTITGVVTSPARWTEVLFDRVRWPDHWAMYVATGTHVFTKQDASFQVEFHWTAKRQLNGIIIRSFGVETLFALEEPDGSRSGLFRRPKLLGAAVQRPDGGEVLDGVPAGEHIRFRMAWPEGGPEDESRA